MNSLNMVQLIGNVTWEPEVKQIPNGQFVANIWLATNRNWKDSSWNKQEATEFHSIIIWWKLAEIVQQYVEKWKKIYIEWRLQTRNWEWEDGKKRYKTEIVADNLILLGVPTKKDDESMEVIHEVAKSKSKKFSQVEEQEINMEDIPF